MAEADEALTIAALERLLAQQSDDFKTYVDRRLSAIDARIEVMEIRQSAYSSAARATSGVDHRRRGGSAYGQQGSMGNPQSFDGSGPGRPIINR